MDKNKIIIAFVGMPGAGKSEAAIHLKEKGIPFVRFGDVTDERVREMGVPLTPDTERKAREDLRRELGMAAYAIKSESKINSFLHQYTTVVLDGLYSWGEYVYLKERFPQLILIHVYAEPKKRYERLAAREIRPVPLEKSRERDIAELEKLDKGGPIAIADHLIENNGDDLGDFYKRIDVLLARLEITE